MNFLSLQSAVVDTHYKLCVWKIQVHNTKKQKRKKERIENKIEQLNLRQSQAMAVAVNSNNNNKKQQTIAKAV